MKRTAASAALAAVLLGWGAVPAFADGAPPPPVMPPGLPGPGDVLGDDVQTPTPGPTYVITPGVGGSELPAPSKPTADDLTPAPGKPAATPTGTPTAVPAPVAGPSAVLGSTAGNSAEVPVWWQVGSGAVLALVLAELGRVLLRRRSRPREA